MSYFKDICSCKWGCKQISSQQKHTLFRDFYKVNDVAKQNTYLLGLIQVVAVNRRRHGTYDEPGQSRRQASVCYTVPNGQGEHIQVCRKVFSDIFALGHCKVQGLVKKKKAGHVIYKDARGQANRATKFTPREYQVVVDHINSFPKEENHYSRFKSEKEFLSADLNINRMFIALKKKYPYIKVNYRFYSKVFKKRFPHLRFGRPRSDTCSVCDLLTNKIKANRNASSLPAQLNLHHRKAENAREALQSDSVASQQPTSDTLVFSVDLEQVIFIPTLTHSDMFYSRQLACYNLGLHVADTNIAFMCLWNEAMTGRGGNEVGSVLLKMLLSGNLTAKKKVTIWSDNCIGQNKNRMVLMALIYLVASGKFIQIEQKFLVTGHTYLPCDRDFAQIERRKRLTKLFVPSDIEKMIKETRHNNPFQVVQVQQEDFKDLQQVADEYINTTKINISKACWIRISAENPTRIQIKTSFSEVAPWQTYNVLKKGKNLNNLQELSSLQCKNRISAPKLQNLKDMLDYIPLKHVPFYENLIANTEEQGVEN